jgi:hypothetical protein
LEDSAVNSNELSSGHGELAARPAAHGEYQQLRLNLREAGVAHPVGDLQWRPGVLIRLYSLQVIT